MEFGEEEALLAADNCEDVYAATKFLRQECELCANVINVTEVKNTEREIYIQTGRHTDREMYNREIETREIESRE